jgi:hypothetical protein
MIRAAIFDIGDPVHFDTTFQAAPCGLDET